MEFKEKVISTLSDPSSGISSPAFNFEEINNEKIGGFVISDTFSGMPQLERQNLVWDYLEKKISSDELLNIVSLITITPEEEAED